MGGHCTIPGFRPGKGQTCLLSMVPGAQCIVKIPYEAGIWYDVTNCCKLCMYYKNDVPNIPLWVFFFLYSFNVVNSSCTLICRVKRNKVSVLFCSVSNKVAVSSEVV